MITPGDKSGKERCENARFVVKIVLCIGFIYRLTWTILPFHVEAWYGSSARQARQPVSGRSAPESRQRERSRHSPNRSTIAGRRLPRPGSAAGTKICVRAAGWGLLPFTLPSPIASTARGIIKDFSTIPRSLYGERSIWQKLGWSSAWQMSWSGLCPGKLIPFPWFARSPWAATWITA